MATRTRRTTDRITVEALKYYVPLFQQGEAAEKKILEHCADLSPGEKNHLEAIMKLKHLSAERIAALSGPLITREINKIIANSHLKTREDLFDLLYFAGIDGMKRGLRRFEVDKLNASSTNYLFQWIVTYAKKELVTLEAPFGIPPSRFQRYKKISAVRKKLSAELERYATNEEVLEFFASGRADLKTMHGKLDSNSKPSKANQRITLELVEEQERFEKQMLSVELLDPLDSYSGDVQMSEPDAVPFAETVFGAFSDSYAVTERARVVIMSELTSASLSESEVELLQAMPAQEYKNLANQWKNLVKDREGPFYEFLKANVSTHFTQFDVRTALKTIESYEKPVNSSLYRVLFTNESAGAR